MATHSPASKRLVPQNQAFGPVLLFNFFPPTPYQCGEGAKSSHKLLVFHACRSNLTGSDLKVESMKFKQYGPRVIVPIGKTIYEIENKPK